MSTSNAEAQKMLQNKLEADIRMLNELCEMSSEYKNIMMGNLANEVMRGSGNQVDRPTRESGSST